MSGATPEHLLHAVRRHVEQRSGAVAVVDGDREATYGELWGAAWALRERLLRHGVRPGDVVALVGPRSPELVAGVLGTWLAGAAYLPLDPQHPQQRLAYILDDACARAVVGHPSAAVAPTAAPVLGWEPVPRGRAPAAGSPVPADLSALAYLIYTSGSTGKPKGVLIPHLGLANFAAHFAAELRATPSDTTLWTTTFAFDMAGTELFVPLASGGRIAVAPDEARADGRLLRGLMERHAVDILEATPTTWRAVLDQVAPALPGRRAIIGGEPAPLALLRQLAGTGCELHHLYGPTETTIWSTSAVVPPDVEAPVTVGRPIRDTHVMVVGPDGREQPVGAPGEVCIAGSGVALGYHNRPELTAERFGEHPRHGRFYRTGDVGRWRADGTLELLGRADRQVKLRGNRVELGEVEAALDEHPEVRAAAVVVAGDLRSDAELVAFVETRRSLGAGALWEHARAWLPAALVPHRFVRLDALPVNANEKVDYPALTRVAERLHAREEARSGGDPRPVDAETRGGDLLADLTALWRRLLGREDAGAGTNFFLQGGHSLLGMLLLQEVEGSTGVRLRLFDLFEHPTPAELAARLEAAGPGEQPQARSRQR